MEAIQCLESVVKNFSANNSILLMMMNKNRLALAKDHKPKAFVQGLAVCHKNFNQELVDILQKVHLNDLYTRPFIVQNGYLITALEIKDVAGINSGLAVMAKKIQYIK